jgi:PAS domain S-box-containing protein
MQPQQLDARSAPQKPSGPHLGSRSLPDIAEAALDASGIGIWEYDIASGVVTWSDSTFRIFGLPADGSPQSYASFLSHVHPEDHELAASHVAHSLGQRDVYVSEFRICRSDGATRTILCRGRAVVDENDSAVGLVGALVDITEQRETETLRDALVDIVSHDLKNPIGAILGGIYLILKMEPPAAISQIATRIRTSANRMRNIVESLLDASRVRREHLVPILPRPTDLGEVAARVIDEMKMAHPSRSLHLVVEDDAHATCDEDRIEQVLSNLMVNGLVHGDPEGPVDVRLLRERADGGLVIEVHNLGDAIPKETAARMFTAFGRGAGVGPGLGLGLFIANEIVAAHGGTLDFTSSRPEGTTFRVRLPAASVGA